MALTHKTGNELTELLKDDLAEIAELANSEWVSVIKANADLMRRRFHGGQMFMVGYHENKPVSVLETMLIRCSKPKIPEEATYERLTGNGTFEWTDFNEGEYKLLVLVDLTTSLTTKKGFGGETLNYSLDHIAQNTDIEFVWSYTPDISAVKKIHLNMDASSVGMRILNAREKYKNSPNRPKMSGDNPQDVIPFDYTNIIRQRRIKMGLIVSPLEDKQVLGPKEVKALQYGVLDGLNPDAAADALKVSREEYDSILSSALRKAAVSIVYDKLILKK